MEIFQYTLVCDGPTDANLIPILDWILRETGKVNLPKGESANLTRLPKIPATLSEKILKAVELYPCKLLFLHRDAEKQAADSRYNEIRNAIRSAKTKGFDLPAISVVPIRMLEAWLIFNENAIRHAAGNPNGRVKLALPSLSKVETVIDPKTDLQNALRVASELRGRRLKKFNVSSAFWRIADQITDYSPLRRLSAFKQLENDVAALRQNNWK